MSWLYTHLNGLCDAIYHRLRQLTHRQLLTYFSVIVPSTVQSHAPLQAAQGLQRMAGEEIVLFLPSLLFLSVDQVISKMMSLLLHIQVQFYTLL